MGKVGSRATYVASAMQLSTTTCCEIIAENAFAIEPGKDLDKISTKFFDTPSRFLVTLPLFIQAKRHRSNASGEEEVTGYTINLAMLPRVF